MQGVASVLTIRCVPHRDVAQLNRSEFGGGECGACVEEAARRQGREEAVVAVVAATRYHRYHDSDCTWAEELDATIANLTKES